MILVDLSVRACCWPERDFAAGTAVHTAPLAPPNPLHPAPGRVMKVLLCGAAGFTGRATLEELLAAGHTVRAWDLAPESWVAGVDDESVHDNPRCEKVFGSIADYDLVEKYITGATVQFSMIPTDLVHTSALTPSLS